MARVQIRLPGRLIITEMEDFQPLVDALEKASFVAQPYLNEEEKDQYPDRADYYSAGHSADFEILPPSTTIDSSQQWYEDKDKQDKVKGVVECEEED